MERMIFYTDLYESLTTCIKDPILTGQKLEVAQPLYLVSYENIAFLTAPS